MRSLFFVVATLLTITENGTVIRHTSTICKICNIYELLDCINKKRVRTAFCVRYLCFLVFLVVSFVRQSIYLWHPLTVADRCLPIQIHTVGTTTFHYLSNTPFLYFLFVLVKRILQTGSTFFNYKFTIF